jgi:hypothetical protein
MTAPYPVSKAASLPDFQNGNDRRANSVSPAAPRSAQTLRRKSTWGSMLNCGIRPRKENRHPLAEGASFLALHIGYRLESPLNKESWSYHKALGQSNLHFLMIS